MALVVAVYTLIVLSCMILRLLLLLIFNHNTIFLAMKMAVASGKVTAFNPSQDVWPLYVKRLGHVFTANGITEEPKK